MKAPRWQEIVLPGAEVKLAPNLLDAAAADRCFEQLLGQIPWERHRLRLFGRDIDAPRLSCWIGDADAVYTYSGTRFTPNPWLPLLLELKVSLEQACATRFNSVLANLYRDGRDSMGWHSDDEPELGPEPMIASLSLGETRRFALRRRGETRQAWAFDLPAGSLLLMSGATQRHYQHALPKTPSVKAARLNLTFRWVRPVGSVAAPSSPGMR